MKLYRSMIFCVCTFFLFMTLVLSSNDHRQQHQQQPEEQHLQELLQSQCKDFHQIADYISCMTATVDAKQDKEFKDINTKLDSFIETDLAKLNAFVKRIDNLESTQQKTTSTVDEIKGNLNEDNMRSMRSTETLKSDSNTNDNRLTTNIKLDGIAAMLSSTRFAVQDLQNILKNDFTNQTHNTNNLRSKLAPGGAANEIKTSCLFNDKPSKIVQFQLTSNSDPFYIRCENEWTVIMSRDSDSINFERGWLEYKRGFGNVVNNYFIGLEKLHALTNFALHELRVELEDYDGNVTSANYGLFAISGETDQYTLNVLGDFTNGGAGDALSYHAGSKFSTFDNDNDGCLDCNCALKHKGGWWFNWCATSNLMGSYAVQYPNTPFQSGGMFWDVFRYQVSLSKAKMLIRPVEQDEARR